MKDYSVKITETLQRSVIVQANSPDEAIESVREEYDNEDIILDSSDFNGVDISIDYGLHDEYKVVNSPMPLVYICSPTQGDYEENAQQARKFCRAAAEMGVVPIAPHLLFTQFLDYSAAEHYIGLQMELELLSRCNELWVCTNHISEDMESKIAAARQQNIPIRRFYSERREVSQPIYQYAVRNAVKGAVNQLLPSFMNY